MSGNPNMNPSEMENQVYLMAKTEVCTHSLIIQLCKERFITCNIALICDIVLNPVEYTLILIVSRTSPESHQFFFDFRSDICNVNGFHQREKSEVAIYLYVY